MFLTSMAVMLMVAMRIIMVSGVMMIWDGFVAGNDWWERRKMRVKYEIESAGLDSKLLTVLIRTWGV